MFNLRPYLQQRNSSKKEEKCMKSIRPLKFRNRNLKNNKKLSKESNKTFVKEIYKYKYISSISVSFYSKMMPSVKKPKKDLIKSRKFTKRNKNKSKNFNNK